MSIGLQGIPGVIYRIWKVFFYTRPYQHRSPLFKTNRALEQNMKVIIENRFKNSTFGGDLYCNGNLEVFSPNFVYMRNVVLNISGISKVRDGGENLSSVIGQSESEEKVIIQSSFFQIPCKHVPNLEPKFTKHFKSWFKAIESATKLDQIENRIILNKIQSFVILVKRGDYANLYYTLIDLYNAFITAKLFKENPHNTTIILMDSHPTGNLDSVWNAMFGKVFRIGHIKQSFMADKLAWGVYSGPLSAGLFDPPFLREFKFKILNDYHIPLKTYNLCPKTRKETIITLIVRRNYVAHPRNPEGRVLRKIKNEKELILKLKTTFNDTKLRIIQLDKLPVDKQIRKITDTNILVGVHGAGLAYGLLLKSGSVLIELFPLHYKKKPNFHFHQFAMWNNVTYKSWISPKSSSLEWLYVPEKTAIELIEQSLDKINKICRK
ncbi:hypothetical protein KUTeg_019716 [Tegillarca granosa]|uniref:EGF domain-specific O-linked N-acetylglucosamine transferase n=1 Tax=Tegillarca granosa TaxID=220873 RepID=A0ABQ9EDV2_TEGGR|nr:hypothetical protein KUTeg_019716 [Tegillarca granosa]